MLRLGGRAHEAVPVLVDICHLQTDCSRSGSPRRTSASTQSGRLAPRNPSFRWTAGSKVIVDRDEKTWWRSPCARTGAARLGPRPSGRSAPDSCCGPPNGKGSFACLRRSSIDEHLHALQRRLPPTLPLVLTPAHVRTEPELPGGVNSSAMYPQGGPT